MNRNSQNNTHSTLNYIHLNSHSTANAIIAAQNLHIDWDFIQNEPNFMEFIAANNTAYRKQYGLSLQNLYGMEPDEYVSAVWLDLDHRFNDPEAYDRLVNAISKKFSAGVLQVDLLFPLWQSIDVVHKRALRGSPYYKINAALESKAKKKGIPQSNQTTSWTDAVGENSVYMPIEAVGDSLDSIDSLIASVAFRQFMETRDQIDISIMVLKGERLSNEEIGKRVGLTRWKVDGRIHKLRDALRAAGF